MDTVKVLVRTKSFWVFIVVALFGGIGAIVPIPFLGVIIAVLTIFGVSIQGVETVLTQKEIEQARKDAAKQHTEAMQEVAQARGEAAKQHTEALQEIEQARKDAAIQYADAMQEIKKARDEARAENILLDANRFATSLIEKDARVNQAVALCPDFKQREYRRLGLEMSAAVIGNVDYVKWQSMKAAGYTFEPPLFQLPLEEDEKIFFTDHAISYLTEAVLNPAIPDAQGLLYLACMYGCRHQYDEMIMVLDKASQISQIVQVMKAEYRERPMMLILVGACGSDQTKIERLRKTLDLPRTTITSFCKYVKEFPLKTHQLPAPYIEWIAVRKSEAAGESGTFIIKITPPYPSNQEKVDAFFVGSNGMPETIVPVENRVSVEELYSILASSFILFCPIG
jgi:hypothetical protein